MKSFNSEYEILNRKQTQQKCILKENYDLTTKITIILFFINFLLSFYATVVYGETACATFKIEQENFDAFHDMKPCDVIEGSVSIIRLNLDNINSSLLLTRIREITGYLLIYQVSGLKSLEYIFPNLSVIRGNELFGKYSLIIYQNNGLLNIGLKSLVNIIKGSVRIDNNPTLCFVDTINWIKILSNMKLQHYVLKRNKNSTECPTCPEVSTNSPTFIPCWNQNNIQKICPDKCGNRGCNSNDECCDSMCLTDCNNSTTRFCNTCRYFKDSTGECVETCKQPPKQIFEVANRKCIPQEKCNALKQVTYNGKCIDSCPKGYFERNHKCELCQKQYCEKTCNGTIIIKKISDLKNVRRCTTINGSLIIQLNEERTKSNDELANSLSDLKIIQGYLKIIKSPQLVTLYFLKNLQVIEGRKLFGERYSLYVIENYHLEKLFMPNQTLQILSGKIFFHFNPKLCYETIEKLKPFVAKEDTFSITDVSNHTNGARVVCEPYITNITVAVEDRSSAEVLLKVIEPITFDDKRLFLGYLFYYIEAPYQNVSIYDNRHGCGHDNWNLDVDTSKNRRHIIRQLKPYTQYAYFVKTFAIATAHLKQDAFSEVQYFETLPDIPGPVRRFFCHAKNETAIVLHWWPPSQPQGKIKKYIINYQIQSVKLNSCEGKSFNKDKLNKEYLFRKIKIIEDDANVRDLVTINSPTINTNSSKKNQKCICNFENHKFRGPPPEEDDFYERESITFEDSLTDFIFIPLHFKNPKPRSNTTNILQNSNMSNQTNMPKNITTTSITSTQSKTSTTNIENTTTHTNFTDNFSTLNSNLTKYVFTTPNSFTTSSQMLTLDESKLKEVIDAKKLQFEKLTEKINTDIDNGPGNLTITKSQDKCYSSNYEDCWKKNDEIMIDGNNHKLILGNLHPSTLYKISIRACNENVVNCSIQTIIEGRTMDPKTSL